MIPAITIRLIGTFASRTCHPAKFSSTGLNKDIVLTRKFVRDPVGAFLVERVF